MVCLPAFGDCRESWRPLIDALSDRFEVAVMELPGLNGAGRLPVDPDLASIAGIIAAVLGQTWAAPWTIVGHSAGSALAVRVANLLNGQCESIVTRAALSAWSRPWCSTTTGSPADNALIRVPWPPPCVTTSAAWRITTRWGADTTPVPLPGAVNAPGRVGRGRTTCVGHPAVIYRPPAALGQLQHSRTVPAHALESISSRGLAPGVVEQADELGSFDVDAFA
jgi:pimeloyl-ACP methyl ester carboxylesterase